MRRLGHLEARIALLREKGVSSTRTAVSNEKE
jgi:hypothetical protein